LTLEVRKIRVTFSKEKNMKKSKKLTRRDFLRYSGLGTFSLLTAVKSPKLLFADEKKVNIVPAKNSFDPDLEVDLKATWDKVSILPGEPTKVWSYGGKVLRGDPGAMQTLQNSYLGPVFRVRKGQKIRINFTNEIDEHSIIHWHGLHLPEEMDGHPRFVIPYGKTYVYEFEVRNRAGSYWYHPHPHRRTGPQVYAGLAGMFIVTDEEEQSVPLPTGMYDIPLVIQDRTFNSNNQFVYFTPEVMNPMLGFFGDSILVNGQLHYELPVSASPYRLRVLNGSNARIYKLAWSNGEAMTVIGTDGGLLDKPLNLPYVVLGPGERVDIWADFSKEKAGNEISLMSLSFFDGFTGGMGSRGMMGGPGTRSGRTLPNGAAFPVLKVRVVRHGSVSSSLPTRLSRFERFERQDAVNAHNPKPFIFAMQHMAWTINGRIFEMEDVAHEEIVRLNTMEVWDFINGGAGMGMMGMMQMPHPVHVHGLQFQVTDLWVDDTGLSAWETVRDGFPYGGFKDTVLLMPGVRMRTLLKFEDFTGLVKA
jgi:FtsP/CotA-like multicopper oxidase with cupredoxin domain